MPFPAPVANRRLLLPLGLLLLSTAGLLQAQHDHPPAGGPIVGQVDFNSGCAPPVAPQVNRAVAMLHSFWFEAAEREFTAVAAADPACVAAHWGLAMTLMGNPMTRALPSAEALAAGRVAAEAALRAAEERTPRERRYAEAVHAYYQEPDATFAERMSAHAAAMQALHDLHPDDTEAAIFLGRAMVALAPPEDLTYSRQLAAADLLLPLFERLPDHPGLAHYLIHAFDAPALADRGREAARAYAGIAPAAPHALHMPSHIFTRLGDWEESIDANARSARAEPDSNAAVHPMDYLVYAHLQLGQDAVARNLVERAVQNPDRYYSGLLGYNFTAMPARLALERSDWTSAAALRLPVNALPYVEAVTRFARALGASRSGDVAGAEAEIDALASLEETLRQSGDNYWATVVEAQRLAAEAWTAQARGDGVEAAAALATQAAEVEERVEKHPVTPGPILPARELLGDMLLLADRPADALEAYEQTLEREPNRARALHGAARAAAASGQTERAREHYRALLALMAAADPDRPEPPAAREFLAAN